MRKYLVVLFAVATSVFSSCSNGQTQSTYTSLSATEFAEKIKELPLAQIVDVRTSGEFSKGHLDNAINIDWFGNEFQNKISQLDKSKAIFVYCLSGSRSSSAATKMRSEGFKEVYELNGGLLKWRAANLPEVKSNSVSGISKQQFDALTNADKLVLVDFYADWCAPCKKMKPYLDEISRDMTDNVVVIRINADENLQLCEDLKIDALPVLQLYKNNAMTWTNTGFISKEDVLKQLK
jgi:thioredoxin